MAASLDYCSRRADAPLPAATWRPTGRPRPGPRKEETDVADTPPGTARLPPPVPIGDYGLLGDTRTAALVSSDGGVDWFCVPAFDGEPVFGSLLGGPSAGTFRFGPALPAQLIARRYRRHCATLETVWTAGQGRLVLA